LRQIFTPNCVGWHVLPALHSASDAQSWTTGPLLGAPGAGVHEVSQLDVEGSPPPPTARQQILPAPQLVAFTHPSAALPLHAPFATHVWVAPPPPPPPTMQHSCVPAAQLDAPHAKVEPAGGVDVGAPVGDPVGALVGALVGAPVPVAIEGGVVVEPPPAGSAPTDGVAGSVGLVVVDVEPPPMTLPSVEPPHATAARMPAREAAQSARRGNVVFIGGSIRLAPGPDGGASPPSPA
jgi:hypothetical protein